MRAEGDEKEREREERQQRRRRRRNGPWKPEYGVHERAIYYLDKCPGNCTNVLLIKKIQGLVHSRQHEKERKEDEKLELEKRWEQYNLKRVNVYFSVSSPGVSRVVFIVNSTSVELNFFKLQITLRDTRAFTGKMTLSVDFHDTTLSSVDRKWDRTVEWLFSSSPLI